MNLKLSKDSGIYCITCTANGKIYIGSTANLYARWRDHRYNLRKQQHSNRHLQRAWNKYGEGAFTITVLEKCNQDALVEREQFYLDTWKPYRRRGFNIAQDTIAPTRGYKHSPEAIAKISTAGKGRKHSAETRIKLKAMFIGRKMSPESCAKMSESAKNRAPMSDETRAKLRLPRSVKATPERKAKIGIAHRGKIVSPDTRAKISLGNQKYIYTGISPTGEEIIFSSLREFCKQQGFKSLSNLGKAVNGKRRHYKGWTFSRVPINQEE